MILSLLLFFAAALLAFEVFKNREAGMMDRHNHFTGAYGLLLVALGVSHFVGQPLSPLIELAAFLALGPPVYWLGRDVFAGFFK